MKSLINKKLKKRILDHLPSILGSESKNWFDAKDCSILIW